MKFYPKWSLFSEQVTYIVHVLLYVYIMLPVSLPRLVNFDWRVDVKTSSDSATRMAQPTCIVQMKVSLSFLSECLIGELTVRWLREIGAGEGGGVRG